METREHRERRNDAERLAGALKRLDSATIMNLANRLHYMPEQLRHDIQMLYDFVSEYAWNEREQIENEE